MTTRQAGAILRHLQHLIDGESTKNLSDAELLQRFTARREEAAFAALVQRHGALVWGVCQHLLHHEQDAEDAFQATFLVLSRRAASIRKTESVGSFLYGVAYRIALRAKHSGRRRQVREHQAVDPSSQHPPDDLAWRELQAILDEEVAQLPEKYRSPFVLCCLEGKSREETAHELRCNLGTVSSRIARARQLLQKRLGKRGVTLSAAMCAAVLWNQTSAANVPAMLVSNTIQTIARSAERFSAAAVLAEGALRAMGPGRWHLGGLLILGVSLLAVGVGVDRYVDVVPPETAPKAAPATSPEAGRDLHGDPLPPGALARLGTVRQRAPESHLAVTTDGKEIIALSRDLTMRRFDAQTGALRSVLQLPKANTFRLLNWLSPRGTFALTAGIKGPGEYYLDLWDLEKINIQRTLTLPGTPWGAAFSPNERRVAVAVSSNRQDHQVLVWNLETFQSRVLWSERKEIHQRFFEPVVVFSPDGKRLLSCHLDRTLRCWEVESGKQIWSETNTGSAFLFFSPDGRTVMSKVQLRDAATGKVLERKKLPADNVIVPIGFSPDGRFLVFQTGLEEMVFWEQNKEQSAFRTPRPSHHPEGALFIPNGMPTNVAFTPGGSGFIRCAGALQRWDLSTGKAVYEDTEKWGHTEAVSRLLFSPDGRILASSAEDRTARLWDTSTGRTLHVIPKGLSDHLAVTPDGRTLLTVPYGVGKTVLQGTDITTGRPARGFELADRKEFMTGSRDKELRVTTDGKKVMMLSWKNGRRNDECVLTAWDMASGECLVHKRVPWGEESLLTADGRNVLAPDTATGAIRLLDMETSHPYWQLHAEQRLAPRQRLGGCSLALSPDGRLMAVRRVFLDLATFQLEYDVIRPADMATGRQLVKLSTEGPAVFAFSVDNRLFAVAGPIGIRLWETATWQAIGSIPISNRDVRPQDRACASSLAFSPDGRVLATGHADGTILLWDATLRGSRRTGQLSTLQRETIWTDLAGTDAAKAYAAVWRLADDPASSVSFLAQRLKPVAPVPPELLRSLLEDLDSDQFAVREAAERKLYALSERVASSLRSELKAQPSLEKRKRIERLLATLNEPGPLSGESVRALRAVQVLERIGSAEARLLLERLSRGVESARLSRAANEALTRMKNR